MKLSKFIFLTFFVWQLAYATPPVSKSYVLNADHIEYGKEDNIIIAKGNVEIFKDDYTLKANKIIYDKNKNTAFAYGNITLINPKGEKTNAQFVELNNDLKEGLAKNLTAYLADNNIFIAEKVEYLQDKSSVFSNAKYTPCPLCKDKNPQWQIKARKATYIPKETITFRHSIFEIYGVPVFYTPYLQTHAPDAPPKSGFLIPKKYKYKKTYGHSLTVPVYYRAADNMDLLYSPMFTSTQGPLHQATFRHLLHDSYYELKGNYISPRKNDPGSVKNRYHVKGKGHKIINDQLSLKAKVDRVSDRAYLHNYWDINENYLTSDATLIYQNARDYGTLSSFYFQDLLTDPNNLHNPSILPLGDYHKEFFHGENKFVTNANFINILRKGGQLNTKRFSTQISWEKEASVNNHRLGFFQKLKASIFNFSHKPSARSQYQPLAHKKEINIVTPESEMNWSYPLIALNESYTLYINPIVNLIVAPNSSKNGKVINEDSKSLELTDINLFSDDRYAGYDQAEYGNRANYGITADLLMDKYHYNFLLGQVYRQRKTKDYSLNSGLYNKHLSDYVGHVSVKPTTWLSIFYRFRFDEKRMHSRKQELDNQLFFDFKNDVVNSITLSNKISKINYIKTNDNNLDDLDKVITLNTNIKLFKEWFVEGSASRNFTKKKNFLVQSRLALGYNGQCTTFKLSAIKDFTHDAQRNIKSNKGFTFDWDINLKNIN